MRLKRWFLISALVLPLALLGGGVAQADHAWENYKWCTVDQVVDLYADVSDARGGWARVTPNALAGWNRSERIEFGSSRANKQGVMTVRSRNYGATGSLGVAEVRLDPRGCIIEGLVELNDWYWEQGWVSGDASRRHVTCQEVGHVLGLAHRVGETCMNDNPDNLGYWVRPDVHDMDQLRAIYSRPDGYDSGTLTTTSRSNMRAGKPAWASENWVVIDSFPAPAGPNTPGLLEGETPVELAIRWLSRVSVSLAELVMPKA